jgi:CMP-N,N'-diacetyllegionaminic acid synthase
MLTKKRILAIVPARGGSKGIKLKNLKKIKNKSLIKIVGIFLKKCKFVDFSVLTTDHKKIALEGKKIGLNLINRPEHLSGDMVSDTKVLLHALINTEKTLKKKFDIVVMLHPTSPLRKVDDVKKAIQLLISKNYDSVWTVSETDTKFHPDKQLKLNNNKLKYFTKKGDRITRRQQLSKVYHRNSNAYIVKRDFLKKNKSLISHKTGAYLIKTRQISIDTLEDLNTAKEYF